MSSPPPPPERPLPPPHPAPRPVRRPVPRGPLVAVVALLAVVVLGLAVVAGDRIAADRAQSITEEVVGDALGAPVTAQVRGSWAGWRALVQRRVERVDLQAQQVPLPDAGITLDRLRATITDLQLDGEDMPVEGVGTFVAELGEDQVQVAAPAVVADLLRLEDGALVVDLGIAAVPLDLTVVEGALRIRLQADTPLIDQLLGELPDIPLPVPDGIIVTAATVRGEVLELTGVLDPVVLAAG